MVPEASHPLLSALADLDEIVHVHVGVTQGALAGVASAWDSFPLVFRFFGEFLTGAELPQLVAEVSFHRFPPEGSRFVRDVIVFFRYARQAVPRAIAERSRHVSFLLLADEKSSSK